MGGTTMNFRYIHTNFNVFDLSKSLSFYEKALGLKEERRINAQDGSFIIVFLGDGQSGCQLELTWMRDRTAPYDLGEKEYHIAYRTDDMEKAQSLHEEMGCICYENKGMGIYFIEDPDGYWIEIVPTR